MSPGDSILDHDFIPFEVEEDEPKASTSVLVAAAEAQSATRGRKRSADEMQRDSPYTKKQQIAAESRHTPWATAVQWDRCSNVAQMLNEEVKAFVDYVSPTPQEHETRRLMIQWIRNVIISEYPDAEVLPFGSFETKLYLPLGDIDLVIKSDNIKGQRDRDKFSVLSKLASLLRRANITDNVEIIAKAKVPIIKFITSHGRIPIDISINQTNGLTAGLIVHQFMKEIPALRPLILVIKSFLSQRSMNEVFSGDASQDPSLQYQCLRQPRVLLVEFFETYGRFFQYDTVGISLRSGGHYFNKHHRGWVNRGSPGLLSIEDPQDLTNDVSSGSFAIHRVRQTLLGAYEILSATLCLRGTELLSKHSGSYRSISEGENASGAKRTTDQMSLLGSIMGITQETITRRRVLGDLYSSGTLHKLVGVNPPPPAPSSSNHITHASGKSHSRHRHSRSPPRYDDRSQGHRRNDEGAPHIAEIRRRYNDYGDEEDDDAWAEAYRGAQETLLIHTHASTSSSSDNEAEDGPIGTYIAASDDDDKDGEDELGTGRYAILAPHAKRRRNDGSSLLINQTRSKSSSHANSNSQKDALIPVPHLPRAHDTDDSSNSNDEEYAGKANPDSYTTIKPNGAVIDNPIVHPTEDDNDDATEPSGRTSNSSSARKTASEVRRAYWQSKSGLGAGGTASDKDPSHKTNGSGNEVDGMKMEHAENSPALDQLIDVMPNSLSHY
ncbi:hypothetical protein BS47DRAFT_1393947 [Hydnum rufescens UP504]|uniref:polynucleotide adenylyltransferase n=1 Tax=Hydnum rufescens UP504 TaxID=1448309 RepID=A0A9P6AVY2_9AGAM|nr:hypothetical protein BS47DRAFT_1393947 [Hydnum rufescens UP504]